MNKSRFISYMMVLAIIIIQFACKETRDPGIFAEITTSKGLMVAKLYYHEAPLTVANFIGLAEGSFNTTAGAENKPFFNGLTFHRVVPDFVIQGGCPKGNGTGGPGYTFPNEIVPTLKHDKIGILAMANAGPHTNGSQFYITFKALPDLDGSYTVFGELVEGTELISQVSQGDIIESVKIKRYGQDAKQFSVDLNAFKEKVNQVYNELKAAATQQNAEFIKQYEADKLLVEEKWKDAHVTPSGLKYLVKTKGKGEKPQKGDKVFVHYKGSFLDGSEFDNSYKRNNPIAFPVGLNQVIRAWDEALLDMMPGEQRQLIVPPELAYGERGYRNVIPPYSFLLFDVELIKFEKPMPSAQ